MDMILKMREKITKLVWRGDQSVKHPIRLKISTPIRQDNGPVTLIDGGAWEFAKHHSNFRCITMNAEYVKITPKFSL